MCLRELGIKFSLNGMKAGRFHALHDENFTLFYRLHPLSTFHHKLQLTLTLKVFKSREFVAMKGEQRRVSDEFCCMKLP